MKHKEMAKQDKNTRSYYLPREIFEPEWQVKHDENEPTRTDKQYRLFVDVKNWLAGDDHTKTKNVNQDKEEML